MVRFLLIFFCFIFRIAFNSSSDFYGRITLYKLDLYPWRCGKLGDFKIKRDLFSIKCEAPVPSLHHKQPEAVIAKSIPARFYTIFLLRVGYLTLFFPKKTNLHKCSVVKQRLQLFLLSGFLSSKSRTCATTNWRTCESPGTTASFSSARTGSSPRRSESKFALIG